MTKLEEVARRAGVSAATVSRALRGVPGVSDSARRRIEEVAADLNYSISRSASGLATGSTRSIGVVVPYVARWFFGQVIAGAEEALRGAGYDLMLYAVGDEDARERFFAAPPLRRRVDGVLVLSLPLAPHEVAAMRQLEVPLALVGARADGFNSVRIDDRYGARLAVRHLVALGHRDIALISMGEAVPMGFTPPRDRRAGYRDVLAEHGLHADPALEADGRFTIAGGERAMDRLLAGSVRPTAVFAQSDEMAMGALRAIRRHGLSVPEDISLVGFDGHDMADVLELTTVAQPVHEQGAVAARLLLKQLADDDTHSVADEVVPVELVVRGSTAAPRPVRQ